MSKSISLDDGNTGPTFVSLKVIDLDFTALTEDIIDDIGQLIDLFDVKAISSDDFVQEIKSIHTFIVQNAQIDAQGVEE